jgi:pentatricopeptide repeat protein
VEKPDRRAFNVAMRACAQAGEWEEALAVLSNMTHRGVQPDQYSYNTAINACARAGEHQP